jgi:signal transduction histidine kinase
VNTLGRPFVGYVSSAAIITAFVAMLSLLTWQAEFARYSDDLRTLAITGARSTESFFTQTRAALAFLAEDIAPTLESPAPATANKLETFRKRFPGLAAVALVDASTLSVLVATGSQASPKPSAKDPTLDAALESFRAGEDFSIGRPVLFSDEKWYLALRWAMRSARGETPRFIEALLPLTTAEGFWSGSPLPAGMVLGIVRDDGYLLVRHPAPQNADVATLYRERRSGTVYNKLRERNFPESGLVEGKSSATGASTLTAFQRFATLPLTFRVSVPQATIRAAWWRSVLPLYAMTALLIGGLAAAYLRQTRVQRRHLAERAARLEELEAANRQLRRANEELDSFSFTVAHDLRTPLRSVSAFAQIVRRDFGERLGESGIALVERIHAASLRMAGLIEGMLTFGQYSRGAVACVEVDTAALVKAVVAALPPAAARAQIVVGPLPACQADPALLHVIWSNLLDNAVKFSRTSPAPRIDIGFAEGEFHIRDNGIGFDMRHAANLFSPFQRLHPPGTCEGLGIGLAIVKRLVQRHGGQVRASSSPGHGTAIHFSLSPPQGAAARAPQQTA